MYELEETMVATYLGLIFYEFLYLLNVVESGSFPMKLVEVCAS